MAEERGVRLAAIDRAGPGIGKWHVLEEWVDPPEGSRSARDTRSWILEGQRNPRDVGMGAAALAETNSPVSSSPVVVNHQMGIGGTCVSGPAILVKLVPERRGHDHVARRGENRASNFGQ